MTGPCFRNSREKWIGNQRFKMQFFSKKVMFLGHVISEKGVKVDQEKVKAVGKMKTPTKLKEVRAVLAFVGFHRKFISGFGKNFRTHI